MDATRDIDFARSPEVFGPLAESVRRLIDATVMTDVDDAAALKARSLVDAAVEMLTSRRLPEASFGVRSAPDGRPAAWGNVLIGLRNPIAPPLMIDRHDGMVTASFHLGPAYEGPPGHVHGGVCALILDHVLAATAHEPGRPAVTGTLTLRYRRPTRLGRLSATARLDRREGVKLFITGHIADQEGATVEAEGVFIRRDAGAGSDA